MTYFTRRTCNFSRSRSFVPRTINLFLAGNSSEEGGLFVRACARISDQRFHVTSREAQKNVKKEDETKFQVQVSHRAVQMISKNVVSDNFIVLSSSLVLLIIYSEYIFYFILNEAREREREILYRNLLARFARAAAILNKTIKDKKEQVYTVFIFFFFLFP